MLRSGTLNRDGSGKILAFDPDVDRCVEARSDAPGELSLTESIATASAI